MTTNRERAIEHLRNELAAVPTSVEAASAALRSGVLTSVQLVTSMLERADRHDGWVGSFLARFDDAALARAARADEELASGTDLGPLHGIPVAVKDILAAAEAPTTAQSLVLDARYWEGKDSPVVRRLREAGAVIVGKATTMEFATGLPEVDKPFPIPRNPWDKARWPGGSSSGSGSGVTSGFFLAAIGTDTGGSIRIPAAFCGITGVMPTFGLVPKTGCVPYGYSVDRVGPLARSAWDCAAVLSAIAGADASDPDSVERPVPDYLASIEGGVEGLRIGVALARTTVRPPVAEAFETAVEVLAELDAVLSEVELPLYDELTAATTVTAAAEAFTHHRRDLSTRWNDYTTGGRMSFVEGAFLSAADYVQAQRVRRVGQRRLAELFAGIDLLVTPTLSMTPPPLEQATAPEDAKLRHTTYWNGLGVPVVAAPIGFVDGLPLSMQVVAPPFAEVRALRAVRAYQQHTSWHEQMPDLEATGGG